MKIRFPTRRRTWIFLGLGVLLAVGVAAGAAMRSPTGPAAAAAIALEFRAGDFVEPRAQRLRFDLLVPGTLQSSSQAIVRSKVSATVQSVAVREGDAVEAGQLLVQFDTAALRAARDEREAQLASARASLAQAERTRETNAQLVRRNFIAQSAFDTADSAFQAQQAAVQVAQAQLAQVQLQLEDAQVRAPIPGQIARRFVQPGEKANFDSQLLSIVDLSRLEVQAQAPVADVARVSPGMAVEVEVEGLPGRRFSGVLGRINPSADAGSRTIGLYVTLANPGQVLRAGMFANVRVQVSSAGDALCLPEAAVREESGQRFVWILRDGHIVRRVVSTGRHDEQARVREIVGGVEPGEKVLATRFDNLRDGAPAKLAVGAGA
jgi:membrane fusion protein (multidrug efflux system)